MTFILPFFLFSVIYLEIKEVRRKKAREKELEGIDVSNIVSSSRRRTTASFAAPPPPKPKVPVETNGNGAEDSGNDNNDEGNDNEEDEEDSSDDDGSQSEEFNEGKFISYVFTD